MLILRIQRLLISQLKPELLVLLDRSGVAWVHILLQQTCVTCRNEAVSQYFNMNIYWKEWASVNTHVTVHLISSSAVSYWTILSLEI